MDLRIELSVFGYQFSANLNTACWWLAANFPESSIFDTVKLYE